MPFCVLEPEHCRQRQARLLRLMQERRLDLVLVARPFHVQWLTGLCLPRTLTAAVAVLADGTCHLAHPDTCPVEDCAAEHVLPYSAQHMFTLRSDQQSAALNRVLRQAGSAKAKRIGVEAGLPGAELLAKLPDAEWVDLEGPLWQLRRNKLPDELALMAKATAATATMYDRARVMIAPGLHELDLFNELQAVAVRELGELLTGTGNDYQCNSGGGPPRDRLAQAGELYVLDLGPAYRGYFADNCRTFAVDGKPTDEQLAAWERLSHVFPLVEARVRPGVSCKGFYAEVRAFLEEFQPGGFPHHLGHGLGLFPHEPPYLNPNWDDTFQAGDVFTVEPGLYGPRLKAGIRLENNYRVTADGVELLTTMPLELG